ncbi:hypothetical protein P3T76_009288 [Phytophthora citrophthora]|uniref:Crinkler effector protein N-terminal domain-containing protein n=1 Tax=Phytophthora citrophthora TaxID=4793 RepID=A0AAD9LIM8_9STRA|nr:hypothetical protein P3T76_009288 [Phytophthora citrophthora]
MDTLELADCDEDEHLPQSPQKSSTNGIPRRTTGWVVVPEEEAWTRNKHESREGEDGREQAHKVDPLVQKANTLQEPSIMWYSMKQIKYTKNSPSLLPHPPAGGKLVKLFCAIVGEAGSAFSVRVDESDSVDDLKKAIADDQKYDFAASKLQLSLAKKGAGWLPSAELGAIRKGEDVPGFESVSLVDTEKVAYSTFSIGDVLKTNGMSPPQTQQIHVLVVVPEQDQQL